MPPRARLILPAAILALAACRTPPQETFYTLNPVPEPTESGGRARFSVTVGPVAVPEMVDRPQLVVRRSPNRVDVLEHHRWAQPLGAEIARVLAADLSSRLGGARAVSAAGQGEGADYRVAVDIEQFDAVPGQDVTVRAAWSVRHAGATLCNGRSALREAVQADGYEALAAAYARALARMSAEIADAMR
ncbi:MAG: membrane integrity-associated transporter subunit PqiC [Bacillota bacterium]